jgi:hypothetical protein
VFRVIRWVAGFVIHLLVGGLMIVAGSGKVFGFAPQEVVDSMSKHGFGDKLPLIGSGELITAVLMLVPWTSSLGVLLASAFWGGAICTHMAHGEPYAFQSALLVLVWVGALLRNPDMFSSFRGGLK